MKKVILLLICSIFILSSLALAQNFGKVAGRVISKEKGQPLQDVNVYLSGTEFGTLSNTKGQFILKKIPAGDYTIVASILSYEVQEKDITVNPGMTVTINFELAGKDIGMEGIKVVADRAKQETPVAFTDVD